MQAFTDTILQAIQQNAEWAWLIVFVIAFVESAAVVGLFMPGWVLLVGIGTMIGADVLDFLPIVISAYLGAVIGEYLSYLLGYHYHEPILKWRLFSRHQSLIEHSRHFFEKHGAIGVFFGRFLGPVRAVLPFIAGVCEMPQKTFFWVNLSSGLIWAPLYLIPGVLVGAAFDLEKETAMQLLFILVLISLVLWMAIAQTKKLAKLYSSETAHNKHFAILNTSLSWVLFVVLISILLASSYYEFLNQILGLVWDKLV